MAGEGDAERLVVLLEARIRDFEKNMQKASGTARRSYGELTAGSSRATRQMEQDFQRSTSRINELLASTSSRIGSFGKGLIGGIAGGLGAAGIAGLVRTLGDVAKGIATIGDEAKRAGLSTKAFQELKYVAEQNRIGVDSLVDGIKELNLRADEFITTGGGSAADAFRRLGYDATTLRDKLKDPSALFSEIIGKLGQLDKAAQIRIADEVFGGTGGEKFVQLIGQGEQGIRDTIKAANDLGIVLDDEMIAKADEIDRKFQAISTTVGTTLKAAIIDAASELGTFFDRMNEIRNQSDRTLDSDIATIGQQRLELERRRMDIDERQARGDRGMGDGLMGSGIGETDFGTARQELQRDNEALDEQERRIMNVIRARQQLSQTPMGSPALPNGVPFNQLPPTDMTRQVALADARERIAKIESAGNGGYSALGPVTENGDRAYGRYQVMGNNIGPWSKDTLGVRLTPEQFLNNPDFQDKIFDKYFGGYFDKYGMEGASQAWFGGEGAVGKTGRKDMLGTSVGEYGNMFTGGEKESVDQLKDAWEGLREVTGDTSAIDAQKQAYDQLGEIGVSTFRDIASALQDGKIDGQEMLQIVVNLVEKLLQSSGGGNGGSGIGSIIGNLIGSLFGGFTEKGGGLKGLLGYAGGTDSAPGGLARINEGGRGEIVDLPRGSRVIPHDISKRMAANSNRSGSTFAPVFNIDARGSAMTEAQFEQIAKRHSQAAVAQYDQGMRQGGFGDMQGQFARQKG